MRVLRPNQMVMGSWIGIPLPVSFFMFLIPYGHTNWPGWGRRFHPLSLAPFLLRSSHFSFLGVGVCRPCSGEIKYVYIYIYLLGNYLNPKTAKSSIKAKKRKVRRVKSRKRIEALRVKYLTLSRATDRCANKGWRAERKIRKEQKERNRERVPHPSYLGPFSRILRRAGIIRWAYSFYFSMYICYTHILLRPCVTWRRCVNRFEQLPLTGSFPWCFYLLYLLALTTCNSMLQFNK